MSRVTLYSIPGRCPLRDEARAALEAEEVAFEEVDIRTDRALLRAYRLEIPVVTVDGVKRFVGRIDPGRLRGLLASAPNRSWTAARSCRRCSTNPTRRTHP